MYEKNKKLLIVEILEILSSFFGIIKVFVIIINIISMII